MKLIFKIILYFEVLKSNLAMFENPFQLRHLFGTMFEIDSKIRQIGILEQENIGTFQEKVSTFRQEIEIASELKGCEKYPTPPNGKGYLG